MPNENLLDKSKEIVNLNFQGENPHLAVTSVLQGYSANGRPDALLFKSNTPNENTLLMKSLKRTGIFGDQELLKMSMQNKRDALEGAILDRIKENSKEDYYHWIWVRDFNEDMVVFSYEDEMYAVSYTETDMGVVTIGDSPVKVSRKDVYVDKETGEELIKSAEFLSKAESVTDGEIKGDELEKSNISPDVITEEIMPDTKVEGQEELIKASDVQELIKAALIEREKELEKAFEAKKLVEDTTELVKGYSFVKEDNVELLVKALTTIDGELGGVLFKAFADMNDALIAKDEEIEEVKKSFGSVQTAVEGSPTESQPTAKTEGEARTQNLAELVKARKAQAK